MTQNTSSAPVCKNAGCNHTLRADNTSGYCSRHTGKGQLRKPLKATAEKRVTIAGADKGSAANGSHMARQVSVAREPWL